MSQPASKDGNSICWDLLVHLIIVTLSKAWITPVEMRPCPPAGVLPVADEKLMLYIIHKHAAHAELFPNLGDSKHERENDICILERHTVWLISE